MTKLIFRRVLLWLLVCGVCLNETEATLKSVFVEDLCFHKQSATIDLSILPAGILYSLPYRNSERLDCKVTILPSYGNSVVLSIYTYYIEKKSKLTIEDSDRHKIALLGYGKFEDEKKSIISEGKLIIHYKREANELILNGASVNETAESSASPDFQFTFTQVRNGPCRGKEFKCANGKCIPEKYVCSGHNHCGDNSNKKNCVIDVDRGVRSAPFDASIYWISAVIVGAVVLVILIVVYIIVLLRYPKNKATNPSSNENSSNGGATDLPLQTVSSTVPANQPVPSSNVNQVGPVSSDEPPRASVYEWVRRSLRRPTGTRVNEPVQQQRAESYQVPSMYPSLDLEPTAPEMYGTDNPDFKIEE